MKATAERMYDQWVVGFPNEELTVSDIVVVGEPYTITARGGGRYGERMIRVVGAIFVAGRKQRVIGSAPYYGRTLRGEHQIGDVEIWTPTR